MKTLELIHKLKDDAKRDWERFLKSPKNKELFGDDDEKPRDFKDKTFLYIASYEGDVGIRPVPSGTTVWNSPNIELYNSSGELIPTNELAKGQKHRIEVKVHNDGDMTCNSCIVELFICNPSLGFNRPSATQIGIQSVNVLGHDEALVNFDFIPDEEDVGHRCLFARAYSYVTVDMPDSAETFFPRTDRHIGQQNCNIISQGNEFEFNIVNTLQIEQANIRLKITQNKTLVQNFKLKGLADLNTTKRKFTAKRFLVLKNKESKLKTTQNFKTNKTESKTTKYLIVKLIIYLISLLWKSKIDTEKYEEIKKDGKNTWAHEFTPGVNKMTLRIPYFFIFKKSATIFNIEAIDVNTKASIGGITLIVKG